MREGGWRGTVRHVWRGASIGAVGRVERIKGRGVSGEVRGRIGTNFWGE